MFAIEKVGEALWPEVAGLTTGVGIQMTAAAIDNKWFEKKPRAQTIASILATGGSATLIGYGKAPEFATGLLYFGLGMIAVNTSRWLIEEITAPPVRHKGGLDILALVPRKMGVLAAPDRERLEVKKELAGTNPKKRKEEAEFREFPRPRAV